MFEQIMTKSPVRLVNDLPELALRAGDVGIVCSSWHYPTVAYEVEFGEPGPAHGMRVLLLDTQVRPVGDAMPVGLQPHN